MNILFHRRRGTELVTDPPATNRQNWYTFRVADLTIESGEPDYISGVTDRDGNKNLTASSNQVFYTAAAINGNPAATFGGADDLHTVSNWSSLTQPFVIAGVFKFTNITSEGTLVADSSTSSTRVYQDGTDFKHAATTPLNGGTADNNAHYFVSKFLTGSSGEFRLDGSSIVTGDDGTAGLSGLYIGASSDGTDKALVHVAVMTVFSADVSGSDLTELEAYLAGVAGT